MPHSLRAKLSGLRYKKTISDKDYDRLCKALDNEKVLDKITTEIEEHVKINQNLNVDRTRALCWCLNVIDKYRGVKWETEEMREGD